MLVINLQNNFHDSKRVFGDRHYSVNKNDDNDDADYARMYAGNFPLVNNKFVFLTELRNVKTTLIDCQV